MVLTVRAHILRHVQCQVWVPLLLEKVSGSKRLGCSVGHQQVNRCHTKGEFEEWITHRWLSMHVRNLYPGFETCRAIKTKSWLKVTHGFIPRKIQWHIHTGQWSLVNWWHEVLMRHYIRGSGILMRMAVSLEDGLGLDGDWCISMIPQHQPSVGESPQISDLQIELNYLNLLKTYCIF